jgi:hypothetical protein
MVVTLHIAANAKQKENKKYQDEEFDLEMIRDINTNL